MDYRQALEVYDQAISCLDSGDEPAFDALIARINEDEGITGTSGAFFNFANSRLHREATRKALVASRNHRQSNVFPKVPRWQPGDNGSLSAEGGERRALSAEERMFKRYVTHGVAYVESHESRDLGALGTPAGAVTGGYQLIPEAFYPILTQAQKAWGGLVAIVNQRETGDGAPMKIALSNDTGNLLHESGEPASISETDPSLTSQLLSTSMLDTGIVKVTVQELQDSFFDIDGFIRDNFGKRYYRGLTAKMTAGSLDGNIQSIVSTATTGVVSAVNNAISYDDLTAMYAALDPAYVENASWLMNSGTRAYFLGIRDTLGRPIYVPDPSSANLGQLLGRPVVINQYLDNIAASTTSPEFTCIPLQFGDFRQGYLLRTVKPGLALVRLSERFMDTLEVGFIGYVRAGGMSTNAGTAPILNLVMHE